MAQADLKLEIFLPQTPEWWDYKHESLCPPILRNLRGGIYNRRSKRRPCEY
jgi:hypothetical protein